MTATATMTAPATRKTLLVLRAVGDTPTTAAAEARLMQDEPMDDVRRAAFERLIRDLYRAANGCDPSHVAIAELPWSDDLDGSAT